MRIDRLNHLITILENVPPERFDLGTWSCGTTACAVGWAAVDKNFNAEGFYLFNTIPHLRTEHETLKSWDAVKVFFELTSTQVYHLFSDEEYSDDGDSPSGATAVDVIARIRALIGSQP
jgi:hypothetical protein